MQQLKENKTLCIVTILYNKKPTNSETLCSLSGCLEEIKHFSRIIVWDNSERELSEVEKQDLDALLKETHYSYRHNQENRALSKIYNSTIKELTENDYLIILDHDTTLTIDYFKQLIEAINSNPTINLFLPIVKYKSQIISPANLVYFKGSYWKHKKTGIILSKHTSAVNSGMAISGKYIKGFEYDERLKFYHTDNDFMIHYSKKNKYLFVLSCEINHILNSYEDEPFSKKKARYKEMRKGFLILMKQENLFIYILTHLYLLVYSIKISLIRHDFRYLFIR